MSQVMHRFGNIYAPITCHAWNKSRTQIALSPNNHEVHIYERNGSDWKLLDILNQHDLRVMGIDWGPNTNRIVTCAVDRNAYVWTQGEDKKWKPTLVLLRINRAATCVKWSPDENKFAKMIVAGSADFKVRVFSAYIKDIEKTPEPTPWGTKMPLGHLMVEFVNSSCGGGWIHSVVFSPDGNKICWVSHDSTINIADATKGNTVTKLRHSCIPILYNLTSDGQIVFGAKLDTSQKKQAGGLSAMNIFQSLDKRSTSEANDTKLDSVHQNAITSIYQYSGEKGNVRSFSTSGMDGLLVIWDVTTLEKTIAGLKII
ncbi:WD domain, G-beta repeat [Popillia japonica]|uniref:Arp2/3 complex 41 kDa subunit n=1 Tax=Popillia japonica TaxID=7064 RepID=A0AAW1IB48_POPJA